MRTLHNRFADWILAEILFPLSLIQLTAVGQFYEYPVMQYPVL